MSYVSNPIYRSEILARSTCPICGLAWPGVQGGKRHQARTGHTVQYPRYGRLLVTDDRNRIVDGRIRSQG